ncbi:putative Cytochrome bd2, subunit II [Minicystis rosea]|nr:putative Cytochrome bd2, subunit II [Minicystis rosea]
MATELLIALVMLTALTLYALMGGADFGGGVWDLLASGPRRAAQRGLIEKAIGPIWEANHVWLILVVVLLFAAFPPAFSAVSIALHVPLTLFLVGVVFRGSAFTFRAFDMRGDAQQKRWGLLFSLASVAAPLLLGMMVGALASGRIRVENGVITSGFFAAWLAPFPFLVGLFALALFAFLAAVYLANEADTPDLANDFRRRALASGVAVGALALATFLASFGGAPLVRAGLTERPWTWPLHAATAAAALTAFGALWQRRYALARAAAIAQAALVLLGWAASQYPYFVVPDVTITNAAANPRTRSLVLGALAAGSVLLFPSLYVLFRIFKGKKIPEG